MSKGSRREREAVDLLKQAGYATYRPATVQFGENDPFGLFDVQAYAPHLPPRFVQVKSNGARGRRSWFRHARLFAAHDVLTEMWVMHDGEGWRVIRGGSDSTETVYDERKDPDVGPHVDTPLALGDGVVQWLRDGGGSS